eukprot:Blabericola_migrator_1__2093@NODE_1578_length_4247_cov_155_379665_g1031_i0_p5_GENE_NODE_1578_length_4247_cov_155_379665_g1031_i0NODE_1578_length_4247_cov_155_379665_g1031_i0_p5_ORF_typecomplete_len126_score14_93_NODE_1578_length_4247_cov_155_379665_g1031_i0497874
MQRIRKVCEGCGVCSVTTTSLPLTFWKPELKPLLVMVDHLGSAFHQSSSDWVRGQQDALLSMLATAGHLAQFVESSQVEPYVASVMCNDVVTLSHEAQMLQKVEFIVSDLRTRFVVSLSLLKTPP